MTPALTLLGWADITQLLNQVVHARSQPDTLPLYVPTESVARVREVQAALNESLVQMPSLEPVRLADQFPEVGEMVEGSNEHITDEQVMSMAVKAGFGPVFTTTSIDRLRALVEQAAALRPAAQPAVLAGNWFCGNCRVPVPAPLSAAPAAQPVGEPMSCEAILAGARALNKLQAEACNVDEADHWALYGNACIIDASAILKAAHGFTAPATDPPALSDA